MFLQLEFFLLVRFCRKYSFTTYIASCLVSLYLESLIVLFCIIMPVYQAKVLPPRETWSQKYLARQIIQPGRVSSQVDYLARQSVQPGRLSSQVDCLARQSVQPGRVSSQVECLTRQSVQPGRVSSQVECLYKVYSFIPGIPYLQCQKCVCVCV